MVNDQNKEFILKVIEEIKNEDPMYRDTDSTWVLIGSYAINQNTEQSDIDLLFIHLKDNFKRFKKTILGKQVSVCSVPISYLLQDGEERRYGGYFSAKCLNPFEVFYENELIVNEIYKAAGLFIGKLAGYIAKQQNKETFSADEITAHVFSAYISLHAGYISYFLSYFIAPNFKDIWENLVEKTVFALKASKIIDDEDGNYRYKESYRTYEEYHYERLKVGSYHWSFGSVVHDNNPEFPQWYYENAESKLKTIDPQGLEVERLKKFISERLSYNKIIY